MATALVPLANLTLSSAQATVTFSSIPATYRDLYFVFTGGIASYDASSPAIQFNNDVTLSNYSSEQATAATTTASASTGNASTGLNIIDGANVSMTGNVTVAFHVFDYSATDKHKAVISRYGNGTAGVGMLCGRWANTAAVTTVKFINGSSILFNSGSTFTLYGVLA